MAATSHDPSSVLLGVVGEGSYGVVSKAVDSTGNPIAIKKFKAPASSRRGVAPSVLREAMLLRELNHDNIVSLRDVSVEKEGRDLAVNLVYEYAEFDVAAILKQHKEQGTPVAPATVKSIMHQLLTALDYLHANWVVHRDIAPSNVLITSEGRVKLGDFGLARILQDPASSLTADASVVVTLWYRAPGCIFAELLLGRPLFKGKEQKREGRSEPLQVSQLQSVFRVLGNPSPSTWPGLATLPLYSEVKGWRRYNPTRAKAIPGLDRRSDTYDLLWRMLEYDPAKRVSAREALQHEYFTSLPLPHTNVLETCAVPYDVRGVQTPKEKRAAREKAKRKSASKAQASGAKPAKRKREEDTTGETADAKEVAEPPAKRPKRVSLRKLSLRARKG